MSHHSPPFLPQDAIYNLFFRVFIRRQQIDRLHVSKVDIMTQEEDEQELAHIFLLLIAVQGLVALKLGADVGQLLINPLDFRLFGLAVPDIRYEHGQAAHAIASHGRHIGVREGKPVIRKRVLGIIRGWSGNRRRWMRGTLK